MSWTQDQVTRLVCLSWSRCTCLLFGLPDHCSPCSATRPVQPDLGLALAGWIPSPGFHGSSSLAQAWVYRKRSASAGLLGSGLGVQVWLQVNQHNQTRAAGPAVAFLIACMGKVSGFICISGKCTCFNPHTLARSETKAIRTEIYKLLFMSKHMCAKTMGLLTQT